MKNLLLLFFCFLQIEEHPKDITGKWVVESVDASGMIKGKLTKEEKDALINRLVKPLTNDVFDFKANHHFSLSVNIGNMPTNDSWEYDATNGVILVKELNDISSKLLKIKVSIKEGDVFFYLDPVILKMRKQ